MNLNGIYSVDFLKIHVAKWVCVANFGFFRACVAINSHITTICTNKRTMMVLYRSPEQTALHTYC